MKHRLGSKKASEKKVGAERVTAPGAGAGPTAIAQTAPAVGELITCGAAQHSEGSRALSDASMTGAPSGRRQRWSPEVTYRAGQEVGHEGGVYRSRKDGNLGQRPDTSVDFWFERRGPKLKTIEQIRNQQAATYRALALGMIDRAVATARFRGLEGIARTVELTLLERQIAVAERDGSGTLEVRHVRAGQAT